MVPQFQDAGSQGRRDGDHWKRPANCSFSMSTKSENPVRCQQPTRVRPARFVSIFATVAISDLFLFLLALPRNFDHDNNSRGELRNLDGGKRQLSPVSILPVQVAVWNTARVVGG